MRSYRVIIAKTPQEIMDAQRVRGQVYGSEEGILDPSVLVEGRDVHAFDFRETTRHVVVYAGEDAVGTVRLLLPDPGLARDIGGRLGLDLEAKVDLGCFDVPGVVLGEVKGYCVAERHRRSAGVAGLLFAELLAECRRRGVTDLIAGATLQTDSREDAHIAYALMRYKGLMSARFHAKARVSDLPQGRPRFRIYSDEQRSRAEHGDLSGIELPARLALFTSRLRARCVGAWVFDPYFNVFAAPIAAPLAEIPVPVRRRNDPRIDQEA